MTAYRTIPHFRCHMGCGWLGDSKAKIGDQAQFQSAYKLCVHAHVFLGILVAQSK